MITLKNDFSRLQALNIILREKITAFNQYLKKEVKTDPVIVSLFITSIDALSAAVTDKVNDIDDDIGEIEDSAVIDD